MDFSILSFGNVLYFLCFLSYSEPSSLSQYGLIYVSDIRNPQAIDTKGVSLSLNYGTFLRLSQIVSRSVHTNLLVMPKTDDY